MLQESKSDSDSRTMRFTIKTLIFFIFHSVLSSNIVKMGVLAETKDFEEYVMPNSSPRKTLYCPVEECKYKAIHKRKCCLCVGLTEWEYHNRSIGTLDVILDAQNRSHGQVINKGSREHLYKLQFDNHLLVSFPDRICYFKELVILELRNNLISDIGDISCLDILDTLILSGNQIREVKAQAFQNNLNLRILDLSHNMLATMSPGVFPQLALSSLILHHNYFMSFDITNLGFMTRPFCMVDISHNKLFVNTITNKQNLTLQNIKKGGQGFVDFQHNQIRTIPDFIEKIGVENLSEASRLWDYAIDIRNNPILCDCKLVPIMEMARPLLKLIAVFKFALDILCFEPPNLRGRSLYNITQKGDWEDMNCPLTSKDDCPHGCLCYYKLSGKRVNFLRAEKIVFVNCTDSGLHKLPRKIPKGNEYRLFFPWNLISEISPRGYLKFTRILNLSHNQLNKIDHGAAKLMFNISRIILTENRGITSFPENLKLLNPCRFKFSMVYLVCTCNNIWLKDWLVTSQRYPGKSKCNIDKFYCKSKSKVIPLHTLNADSLLCNKYSDTYARNLFLISLSLVCSSIVFLITFKNLKYEIIILLKKGEFLSFRRRNQTFPHLLQFDVFISFDEQREDVQKWVIKELIPMLQKEGYSFYVPTLSLPIGAIRTEEIERVVLKCRSYIVVLSEEYFGEGTIWTDFEWKSIWKRFLATPNVNITIVNFDLLERGDLINRQMRALFSLGFVIDFHNQGGDINQKIKQKLHKPEIKRNSSVGKWYEPSDLITIHERTPLLQN